MNALSDIKNARGTKKIKIEMSQRTQRTLKRHNGRKSHKVELDNDRQRFCKHRMIGSRIARMDHHSQTLIHSKQAEYYASSGGVFNHHK